jgi:Sulfotransferase domain
MHDFLRQHPEIYLPEKKEIHFFGTDLYSPHYLRDRKQYLDLFAAATDEKRIGEASVWYLYSKLASREIQEFNPDASIIIMLRNPVDMAYSLHGHRLYINSEDIEDFGEALAAEEDRKAGMRLPPNPYPVAGLYYREVARYTEQVKRYLDAFGARQVKIILYDDFNTDPSGVCQEVFAFLNVGAPYAVEISVINASKRIRHRKLASFLDPPPAIVSKVGRMLTTAERRHQLFQSVRELNTEHAPRQPLPAALRRQLQAEFAPDVERLGELLGRDLSHWCRSENN